MCGMCVECVWNVRGTCVEYVWNVCRIGVEWAWDVRGMYVECCGMLCNVRIMYAEYMWNVHVLNYCTLLSIHIGIRTFNLVYADARTTHTTFPTASSVCVCVCI